MMYNDLTLNVPQTKMARMLVASASASAKAGKAAGWAGRRAESEKAVPTHNTRDLAQVGL